MRLPRLQMRWLPMRLEAMLGVRWLRRLLQILGPLSLVLMRSGS
jgi:hypothetical protein